MRSEVSNLPSATVALIAAVFAVTATFLGIPAIIYEANHGEFAWPFKNLIVTYWPWAVGFVAVFVVPTLLLPVRPARWWAALTVVVATYIWAHGVFQTHEFGDVDGREWSAIVPAWQSAVELFVILVVSVLVWVFSIRNRKLNS